MAGIYNKNDEEAETVKECWGPKRPQNKRISHSGSKAQYKGNARTTVLQDPYVSSILYHALLYHTTIYYTVTYHTIL